MQQKKQSVMMKRKQAAQGAALRLEVHCAASVTVEVTVTVVTPPSFSVFDVLVVVAGSSVVVVLEVDPEVSVLVEVSTGVEVVVGTVGAGAVVVGAVGAGAEGTPLWPLR